MPKKKLKAYQEDCSDSEESSSTSFEIDNECEIENDDEQVDENNTFEPFEQIFRLEIRSAFPKPLQIVGEKCVNTLEQVFDKNNKMCVFKIPSNYIARSSQPKRIPIEYNKLCRSLLMNKECIFGSNCKFAHNFTSLSKCKFDFCKKTKLIGSGVFKNVTNSPCTLRHNMETMDSLVFRNRENTAFAIRLEIFKQYFNDFKEMIHFPMKCSKLEFTVI